MAIAFGCESCKVFRRAFGANILSVKSAFAHMVRRLSIVDSEKVDARVCYGQPYGKRKIIMREKMYAYVLIAVGLFWIQSTNADSDFFPGK